MKAAVAIKYGGPDVIEIRDIAAPTVKAGEILIRVVATTVNSGDARVRGARFPSGFWLPARLALGLTRPRKPVLGTELSGVVQAVGGGVSRYRPGDHVFAFSGAKMGCHVEYKTMPEDGAVARLPSRFSFEEAAAISFGGTTALYFLRDVAKVQRGERVLINGASGTVGTAAIQLARHFGAHVTGVCSAANAGIVRSLGADAVFDYQTLDFARSGEQWDVIFDVVGDASLPRCRNALKAGGRLLLAACGLGDLIKAPIQSTFTEFTVAAGPAPDSVQHVTELRSICEAGAFKPIIDSRYPFERIAAAHARVDSQRKVGSVVVTMGMVTE